MSDLIMLYRLLFGLGSGVISPPAVVFKYYQLYIYSVFIIYCYNHISFSLIKEMLKLRIQGTLRTLSKFNLKLLTFKMPLFSSCSNFSVLRNFPIPYKNGNARLSPYNFYLINYAEAIVADVAFLILKLCNSDNSLMLFFQQKGANEIIYF